MILQLMLFQKQLVEFMKQWLHPFLRRLIKAETLAGFVNINYCIDYQKPLRTSIFLNDWRWRWQITTLFCLIVAPLMTEFWSSELKPTWLFSSNLMSGIWMELLKHVLQYFNKYTLCMLQWMESCTHWFMPFCQTKQSRCTADCCRRLRIFYWVIVQDRLWLIMKLPCETLLSKCSHGHRFAAVCSTSNRLCGERFRAFLTSWIGMFTVHTFQRHHNNSTCSIQEFYSIL